MKNTYEKGITLIALVITIIILIILASVSISLVLGDDGIITKSRQARENMQISANEEQYYLSNLLGEIDMPTTSVNKATGTGTLSGEGTEANPYLIQSVEDLIYLSNQVKNGNTYAGKYFKLEKSLDFKNELSYLNPSSTEYGDINEDGTTSTLYEELTTGKGFNSIGIDNTGYNFEGIFDGNNKFIKNITGRSLFGMINNATIQNLQVLDVNITDTIKYGYYGGIVACGKGDLIIENCKVTGLLKTSSGYSAAGIIGYINSPTSLSLSNLSSGVNIEAPASVAGIVSKLSISSEKLVINNCSNSGNLSGGGYVGGIVGDLYAGEDIDISNCYNTGNINATSNYVGGILARGDDGSISHCYNTGNITCVGYARRNIWC